MSTEEFEKIVELTVHQVMAAMNNTTCVDSSTKGRALVVGSLNDGAPLCEGYEMVCSGTVKDAKSTGTFHLVVITALTLRQLSSLALACPCDTATELIMEALLDGTEVVLLENGLPHTKYKNKGSAALRTLLEQYAGKLRSFGVRFISGCCTDKIQTTTVPVCGKKRVITEMEAKSMVLNGEAMPDGKSVILTPAAKDIFLHRGR